MEINVSVENVDLNSEIAGHIYDEESDSQRHRTLGDAVAYEIANDLKRDQFYGELKKRVNTIRDEEIRKLVSAEITAAMSADIPLTNGYGEQVGKTTTLRELIVAEGRKFFTEKRRANGRYDGPTSTAAQDVVAAMVKDALTKELATAVAEEKTRVVEAVRAKGAELIGDAIKQGLAVTRR
jgi:hypothetical protein